MNTVYYVVINVGDDDDKGCLWNMSHYKISNYLTEDKSQMNKAKYNQVCDDNLEVGAMGGVGGGGRTKAGWR